MSDPEPESAVGAPEPSEEAVGAPAASEPPEDAPEDAVGAPEAPPAPSDREREAVSRLLASAVARSGDVLASPEDVLAFCDEASLLDADGWPDEARIRSAADQLVSERPYLAARKFSDVGQGARKTTAPRASLGDMLRRAAG